MTHNVRRVFNRLRALRGIAPTERWTALRSRGPALIRRRLTRIRRRAVTGQVRVVEAALGAERANSYFWHSPTKSPTWFDVQRRIERLHLRHPEETRDFVEKAIEHSVDPSTVIGMARHPFSREILRSYLHEHALSDSGVLASALRQNRLIGGAFAGAARLLLDPDAARRTVDWINDLYQLPDDRVFQIMDSAGSRPVDRPARHRLVVAEHLTDTDAVAVLLPNADKVTLLSTSDTFGRADFSTYSSWPDVGDVRVENVRSRITRFSQAYVDLHDTTAAIARDIADRVADVPGLLTAEEVPIVAVDVADHVFFQALKIAAVEELLRADFDHIVLAIADQRPDDEFLNLMAGVSGLADDPRLEVVSVARSASSRIDFWARAEVLRGPPPRVRSERRLPEDLVIRKFDDETRRLAAALDGVRPGERPWVPIVTTNNPAYNDSTASYVHELQGSFEVTIAHMTRNATELAEHLLALGEDAAAVPIDFLAPPAGPLEPLAALITARLDPLVAPDAAEHAASGISPHDQSGAGTGGALADRERIARWTLRSGVARLSRDAIAPAIARMRALDHWFSRLDAAGRLPAAVVLTPQRSPSVTAVTCAARRFGVPSISLEPHAQDANYSRYIKTTADYYGVMSDYFRTSASAGFGIAFDRTTTIGSPRQVTPAGYDPEVARRAARAAYEREHGVRIDPDITHLVFFCQPSDWTHVAKVWANVLTASLERGCRIFLKPHPEETASRLKLYLDLAAEHDLADRVITLDTDADTAIALGDLVLTAYSAAAIDAAVRQQPVICVTDGDERYPVDLPAILDAHLARSAAELSALVAEFEECPDEFRRRARSLVEREPQFVNGPGDRLRALVTGVIEAGRDGVRDQTEIPDSLFLDGPHPIFTV